MSVEGNCRKSSHAAWNGSKQCAYDHLAELGFAETLEEKSFRFDVEGLYHHHHDDDKSCDQYGVAQCVCEYV